MWLKLLKANQGEAALENFNHNRETKVVYFAVLLT